jgi:hypothetical protein
MIFWKKPPSPPDEPVMKSIVYRGGVVTFRIPSHWREEYSDVEGGMFYEDRPDSGTLRLTIILATAPRQLHSDSGMDLLLVLIDQLKRAGRQCTKAVRSDGNAVLKYLEAGLEQGIPLTIFYWVVANPLPPLHARIATFSFTIPTIWRNEPRVRRDLEMLEAEIEAATFSPEVGVVSE